LGAVIEINPEALAIAGARVRSLKDVIAFNEAHAAREMWFGQEIMLRAEDKGPLTDKAYLEALAACRRLSRAEGIDAVIEKQGLDAIVPLTGGLPWLTDWVNGDHDTGGCSTPAAVAGYPHITVPAGFIDGLPAGISFFGRAWSEPAHLKIAAGFEALFTARRPPRFLRTVEFKAATRPAPASHRPRQS
jgi:amidase